MAKDALLPCSKDNKDRLGSSDGVARYERSPADPTVKMGLDGSYGGTLTNMLACSSVKVANVFLGS